RAALPPDRRLHLDQFLRVVLLLEGEDVEAQAVADRLGHLLNSDGQVIPLAVVSLPCQPPLGIRPPRQAHCRVPCSANATGTPHDATRNRAGVSLTVACPLPP